MIGEQFHQHLRNLAVQGPVAQVPELDAWVVLDRALVIEVLRDAERFTVDDPRFSTGRVLGPSMLSLDGFVHSRHRAPFADAFKMGGPGSVSRAELEAALAANAQKLVAAFRDVGHGDLVAQLAAPMAAEVMCDVLGLVGVETAELLSWYRAIVDSVTVTSLGGEPHAAGEQAMHLLRNAVEASLPHSPLLASAGQSLTLDQVTSNAAVLLFGGLETTEAMIAIACMHIVQRPHVLAALIAEPQMIPDAIEESVRLEPAAARLDRYTTCSVRLGDFDLPKGAFVLASVAAANRDPHYFDRPDEFVLGRPNARQHVSFAQGPHACLATHLAKAQTAAAVAAVLTLPGIVLRDHVQVVGEVFRKPQSVPVGWSL
jgi:cytochrome P450